MCPKRIACGSPCHTLLATKLRNQKRRNPLHNSLDSPFFVVHAASVVGSFNLIRIIGSPRLLLKPKPSQMQTLTDFEHGLLTHEDLITDEVRMTVVAGFDHEQFSKRCVPPSLYYDADLSDGNALLTKLITVGQIWKSRDLLLTVLNTFAKQHGWKTRKTGAKIFCNRFGMKRAREGKEKEQEAGHLGSMCPFETIFKPKKEKCWTGDHFNWKPMWS